MVRIAELLFWLHVPIFITWFGLFFIPVSVWPGRVAFHFWFIMAMVAAELVTGLLMAPLMRKFRIVCPLTAAMQLARGYALDNPKNFDHSFVREAFGRLGIRLPQGLVGVLIFGSLGIAVFQYAVAQL